MRHGSAFAIFLMLNAVTPFITPEPPWLANLPLVVAIMAFLLAFGLSHMRAERTPAVEVTNSDKSPHGSQRAPSLSSLRTIKQHRSDNAQLK